MWEINIQPTLKDNLLISVKALAKNECTKIFHPYNIGGTVHDKDNIQITVTKEDILQG